MRSLTFTHTTINEKVEIFVDQIMGVMFLDKFQSTVIIGNGGGTIPVVGTVDEISKIVNQAKQATKEK